MKKYQVLIIAFLTLCGFGVSLTGEASAQDLTISTDTTWLPGTYTYDNVTVTNSATLTFNGAVTLNTQNLIIEAGSSISANEKGHKGGSCGNVPGEGPGGGASIWWGYAGGGGYGGKGGGSIFGNFLGGASYGSAMAPVDLGSGGGGSSDLQWGWCHKGGDGAGAIKLVISDTLNLNGSITANGAAAGGWVASGGSGGSVYITTSALTGSGSITANGGDGGGGGGRIAVYYKTSDFIGRTEARGKGGIPLAEDGTVVFVDTQNNNLFTGHSFRFQENDSPFNFDKIILNNSKVHTQGNITLTTDNLSIENGSILNVGGAAAVTVNNNLALDTNSNFTLEGSSNIGVRGSFNLNGASVLNFTGSQSLVALSINLNGGSILTLAGEGNLNVNDIALTNNSIITNLPESKIYFNTNTLTLDSTSSISSNEKGYIGGSCNNIPGEGPGGGESIGWNSAGGGYGGKGGNGSFGALGGSPYGSSTVPIDLGSGGGGAHDPEWSWCRKGGSGGGAIKLVINDTLTLNGSIAANGMNAQSLAGGGSGGSIYIITHNLTGAGALTSNGGNGIGGGGGGRIAVYYKTSTFAGNAEAKGGTGWQNGEDGTIVFQPISLDTPLTTFNLIEISSTTATSQETLSTQSITLNNVQITGDLTGTLNFSNLEVTTLASGAFSGKGFLEGEFTTTLEGVSYQGNLQGVIYPDPKENKLHLKASITGLLINGITEATLTESTPGSGIFDKYQATWKLNRLGTDTLSATLNLEGTVSSQSTHSFTSSLYIYQANYEGNALGSYTGPLSAVLTHLRLTGENEYKGKGFSIISYNSLLGQGEGYSYNQVLSEGLVEFQGLFESPLLGVLQAILDETRNPKTLSGTIERLDLGETPAPDLKVNVWGPTRVSPGQTITYIIEYRNDGVKASADETLITTALEESTKYISASEGAFYNDIRNTVSWDLGSVPAKSSGYLTIQTEITWGLPEGTILETQAIINELIPHSLQKGLFINGIGLYVIKNWKKVLDKRYFDDCANFASSKDLEWITAYDTGTGAGDIDHVIKALNSTATEHNGLLNQKVTGGFEYETVWGYSGGAVTLMSAIMQKYEAGKSGLKTKELVLIGPPFVYISTHQLRDLHDKYGVEKIVLYQSSKDTLGLQYSKDDPIRKEPWLEIRDNYTCKHELWIQTLNNETNKNKKNMSSSAPSNITQAHDPNELLVSPEGNIRPGDRLNYTINYENEGEGIAFGVYITDTLEEDLDTSTLSINNNGVYDPDTRTITWFIGELASKQKGSVSFSVNAESELIEGAEVINFATVYFPSVPETTRTNGTVNRITTTTDTTPPTTTAVLLPQPNQAGWNNSDVAVTLTAIDNEGDSGVAKTEYSLDNINWITYSSPLAITSEGATTVYYKSTDNLNNTESSKSLEVKLDKTPPVISTQVIPQANPSGWNNTDVTVTFTATDSLSGIATVTQPQTITTEGANQLIGGQATDFAGNSVSTSVTLNIDKTQPEVIITTPQEQAEYILKETIFSSWLATDILSGIASATGTVPNDSALDTSTVGTNYFNVAALDNAGNKTDKTATYSVRYSYSGILPPVNPDGSSIFKLGRTIPVKFQLKDSSGSFVSTAVAKLYLVKISDNVTGTEIEAESVGEANTGNLFRYDITNNQYIFNLGTTTLSEGTWQIRISLDDGASKYLNIALRR